MSAASSATDASAGSILLNLGGAQPAGGAQPGGAQPGGALPAHANHPPPPYKPMPPAHASDAPRFDGTADNIHAFLEHYELRAIQATMTQEQMVRNIIQYIDRSSRELWMQFDEYNPLNLPVFNYTWDRFRARILLAYPNTGLARNHSDLDIIALVRQWATRGIHSVPQLDEYTREFLTISMSLQRQNLLSSIQASKLYQNAFVNSIGTLLAQDLLVSFRRTVDIPIESIQEAARWIIETRLSGVRNELTALPLVPLAYTPDPDRYTPYSAPRTIQPAPQPLALPAPPIKMEEQFAQLLTRMNQLLDRQEGYKVTSPASSAPPPATAPPARTSDACHMCGEASHYLRDCPVLVRYLQEKRCLQDANDNKIILPNGHEIPRKGARTLQGRIDAWLRVNPEWDPTRQTGGRPAEANFLAVLGDGYEEDDYVGEDQDLDESETAQEAWLARMQPQVEVLKNEGRPRRMEGVEMRRANRVNRPDLRRAVIPNPSATPAPTADSRPAPAPAPIPAPIPVIPRRSPSTSPQHTVSSAPKPPTAPQTAPRVAPIPAPAPTGVHIYPVRKPQDSAQGPAFKYRAPAQDDAAEKEVAEAIKATKVEVTVGQLYGVSPGLRRYFRDFTTTRRIGVDDTQEASYSDLPDVFLDDHAIEAYQNRQSQEPLYDENGRIVAEHGIPLRVLECNINGQMFKGVLDEGSTVVIMSERAWSKTGLPLDPTKHMEIQSANGISNRTTGILMNLPVRVGGITFWLQVQVMQRAPFDLLLGKPFHALSRMMIRTASDGSTRVTLHDPNSETVVTVPTKERVFHEIARPRATDG